MYTPYQPNTTDAGRATFSVYGGYYDPFK